MRQLFDHFALLRHGPVGGILLLIAALLPSCAPMRQSQLAPAVTPRPTDAAFNRLARLPLQHVPWQFGSLSGTMIATAHYRIYTTITNPLYRHLMARVLEAAHRRFATLNPETNVAGPLDCYIFADRPQWERFTKNRGGSNAPVYLQISAGGYCQRGVFVGYDIGRDRTLSVIAHEAWHQYSWFAFKDRLPSWLEEGLATQNEAITWQGATPIFTPADNWHRLQAIRLAVRNHQLWPLADLLRLHAGEVVGLPQRRIDIYYAQLWSLVLFLERSRYRPDLMRLLRDAHNGTLAEALRGTDVSPLEIAHYTEHWNAVAGPAYMTHYIQPDLTVLDAQYRAFLERFTATEK